VKAKLNLLNANCFRYKLILTLTFKEAIRWCLDMRGFFICVSLYLVFDLIFVYSFSEKGFGKLYKPIFYLDLSNEPIK